MSNSESRPVLRDLPLPAKLVLTGFLLAVGLGYLAAMVQLHFQAASPGRFAPGLGDVVARYAGVDDFFGEKNPADPPPAPKSRIEKLISAPEHLPFNGQGSMGPAFFEKSNGWKRAVEDLGEETVRAEREGERAAMIAWINSGPNRRKYYEEDNFPLPRELVGKPITAEVLASDTAVAIRTLIDMRCLKCHVDGNTEPAFDAGYHQLEPYLEVPAVTAEAGAKSDRQISVEKLTQSTHAHILSLAMLFTLTGLTFAFSSYPCWLRLTLAPAVVLAQVAEVSCWWLARLDGVGPYFALAIVGLGAVVGLGLILQITLSLFDLYGPAGKTVLVVLLLVAAGGGYAVKTNVIDPRLESERSQLAAQEDKNGPPPAGEEGGNATDHGP